MSEQDEEFEYEDEENESGGAFRWLQVVVVLLAIGGFFALAWYAYKSGETVDENSVEIVKADKTPIKEVPTNPGGMQIPNQDKTVYGLINGGKTEKPIAERILPAVEEPIQRDAETQTWVSDKIKENQSDGEPVKIVENGKESAPVAPIVSSQPVQEKKVEQFNPAKAVPVAAPVLAEAPKIEKSVTVPNAPVAQVATTSPQPEAKKTEVAVAPVAAPKVMAKEAKKEPVKEEKLPKIRVQLGAYKTEAEARKDWKIKANKFDELSDKHYYIVKINIEGKGTFYRLQVGGFSTAKIAERFCVNLVSENQACLLAK